MTAGNLLGTEVHEEAFRRAFEASMAITDERDEGRFVHVNPALCRILGRSAATLRTTFSFTLPLAERRGAAGNLRG